MATSGFLSSRIVRVALAVAVVVVVLGGVQASRVHHSTGELRLTPSQAPPKLQEFGRDYLRSSSTPKAHAAEGLAGDRRDAGWR